MRTVLLIFAAALQCGPVLSFRDWFEELDLVDYEHLNLNDSFVQWQSKFDRRYPSKVEEYRRLQVWSDNLRRIAAFNSAEQGTLRLRMNRFGGMTDGEFKETMLADNEQFLNKVPVIGGSKPRSKGSQRRVTDMPDSFDWADLGCVSPVKDQGDCGSGWAFSTTSTVECRAAAAATNASNNPQCEPPVSLSTQQLVDCDYYDAGCKGGSMMPGMWYIRDNGGLCSESEYPYTGSEGQCQSDSCGSRYYALEHVGEVDPNRDEENTMQHTFEGCLAVAVEADQFAFEYYSSGVLDGTCGTLLNHGVVITGWGTLDGQGYWKVKNSWGSQWGIDGYILICRGCITPDLRSGECGVLVAQYYDY